jgi:hypothetical protein
MWTRLLKGARHAARKAGLTRLLERARHAARKAGLWPWMVVEQEDLHGGRLTLTWSAWLMPYRVEVLDMGPGVGDAEVSWAQWRLEGQPAAVRLAFYRGMAFAEVLRVNRSMQRGRAAALQEPDEVGSVAS